jgi:signal recognition particle subunit SRP54
MLEELSNKFEQAIQSLKGQAKISDVNIADTVREIRRALLDADVNFDVAKEFTANVRDKALGEGVLTSVNPGQQFTKIVFDELVQTLGDTAHELQFSQKPPTVILIAGLQGSGKTTFSAKLAAHIKKEKGKNPLLVAADVYRPAAVEQLKTLGESISIPVYSIEAKDAVRAAKEGVAMAKSLALDTVIVDTAGRMHVDETMMNEVAQIRDVVGATQTLFVVDAMTGQDAVNTAREFHDRLNFDGVVLTKMDGDTRGGAALSIRKVVDEPILFLSIGEKLDALTPFHPDRLARRILGMGDVLSLVEKAQQQYDEKQAESLRKKISTQSFDLNDFYDQIQKIKKMGSVGELLSMIPGAQKALQDKEIDESAFKKTEAIILSMTPAERTRPEILNGTRRKRIALGSGTSVQEVNELVKQFDQMKKMMKTMSKMGGAGRGLQSLLGGNPIGR